MTVPPPRDRMAAVRVCLQKSHTVGGRPFPRISAHDHRRHGMQVRGVGEEEEFSPAAVVLVHVLHTSHCIIEPLERWWQSLITRSTCPLPRIIAWQRVSQSPHSNPSSSSPPDLRVRRSNAILGPHAIGMSSHASHTTLHHACTILVPVDVSDNGKGRIAREIHRRNISNPDFSSPIHISTLFTRSNVTIMLVFERPDLSL